MFIQAEMLRRMRFGSGAPHSEQLAHALLVAHTERPDSAAAHRDRVSHHSARRRRNRVSAAARAGATRARRCRAVLDGGRADHSAAAATIARGALPADLPPRFAVSASRYAFERRMAEPGAIARTVLTALAAQRRGARDGAPR